MTDAEKHQNASNEIKTALSGVMQDILDYCKAYCNPPLENITLIVRAPDAETSDAFFVITNENYEDFFSFVDYMRRSHAALFTRTSPATGVTQ